MHIYKYSLNYQFLSVVYENELKSVMKFVILLHSTLLVFTLDVLLVLIIAFLYHFCILCRYIVEFNLNTDHVKDS